MKCSGEESVKRAYWKRKFFETMCSECFYLLEENSGGNPDVCPGCGCLMENDDGFVVKLIVFGNV